MESQAGKSGNAAPPEYGEVGGTSYPWVNLQRRAQPQRGRGQVDARASYDLTVPSLLWTQSLAFELCNARVAAPCPTTPPGLLRSQRRFDGRGHFRRIWGGLGLK